MNWPSRVNSPEPPPRERFSKPLVVLGIFFAFVAVLALLFPEQGLLAVLDRGDDAATIRYRESLLRVNPGDTQMRLKVAGSLQRSGSPKRALEALDQAPAGLTPDQQREVAELRYGALQDLFRQARPGTLPWQRLKAKVVTAARELAGPNPPAWRLIQLAADARAAGDLESWSAYRRRIEALEAVANAFPGVEKSFAIQAGREIRIIVKPEEIDDLGANRMAKEISKKIEENLDYPGQIKVTVIRERRSVEYAK